MTRCRECGQPSRNQHGRCFRCRRRYQIGPLGHPSMSLVCICDHPRPEPCWPLFADALECATCGRKVVER